MIYDPIENVMQHEGGFVFHPSGLGGPTKFGISQKTFSVYLGRPASLQEVKDMDAATAREIYERNYYTGPRIHTLPNPPRTLVLDIAINHGPKPAIKLMQRVVNAAGFGPITVDGVLGPQTRDTIEKAATEMGNVIQNALVEEYIGYCEAMIIAKPDQAPIMRTWVRHAERFRKK